MCHACVFQETRSVRAARHGKEGARPPNLGDIRPGSGLAQAGVPVRSNNAGREAGTGNGRHCLGI